MRTTTTIRKREDLVGLQALLEECTMQE